MREVMEDAKYALRTFRRNPGFVLVAVLSLAIGIGTNTAIFSVTNALLLRPLPYPDAERLVILWNRSPGLNITQDWFSTAQYFDIKNGHTGFEQTGIAIGGNENLTGDGMPERIGVVRVSSNLLEMMGAKAAIGRLLTREEDAPGRPAAVLLTYGTWARRYGLNANVLGRTLTLSGKPYIVAGVLAKNFAIPHEVLPTLGGPELAEIVAPLPLAAAAAATDRDHEDYNVVAKLRRGVTLQQAQAEMEMITARLRQEHPEVYPPNGGLTFGIVPLAQQVVGDARRPLLILNGAVGFVLLIACANVANLLLSRAVARQKEMAIRAALGAGRRRIVQQLLTESTLLALAAGALGVALSYASVKALHALGAKSVPRLGEIDVDGRVLLFTLLVSLLAGILFGLVPALRVSRLDLHDHLKEAGRGSGAGAMWGRGNHLRRAIVVAELALSLVLLIAAGLLIRSFARLQSVAPGFNAKNVLTLGLTMRGQQYAKREAVQGTYRQLWERLEHLPGVTAAGGVTALPLSELWAWGPINVEGRVPPPGENFINADERIAGGNYFEAMQIPLRRGRFFNEMDTPEKPLVVIVDEYMAEQLWPNDDPIGKRIRNGGLHSNDPWMTVVGVVGRVKQYALDTDGRIAFYLAHTQFPAREMSVVVRSGMAPAALASAVKEQIRALDPDLPVYAVGTMEARVAESLAQRRFAMVLLAAFAGFSLMLATVGIYGVMAYLVNQGTREIGIRMALGATQRGILRMVVQRGMMLALAGAGIGLAGAFALTRLMRGLLYGVTASDPATFVGIAALLLCVSLAASWIPARRAARVEPMISLRAD